LQQRRSRVLDVLYLILTEGYASTGGDLLVREDLCRTAIRLARLVAESSVTAGPEADALLALCCLQTSRLAARVAEGGLRLLPEQDRARWDQALIAEGMHALVRSARGPEETALHLEAALAARHVGVAPGGASDWGEIVALYDRLLQRKPTAIVRLNRAIAVAERDGASAGLVELEPLREHPAMQRHVPYHATVAELHGRLGNDAEAGRALRRALHLDPNPVERRHLESRLAARGGPMEPSGPGGAA
jgi:RNA polymerase sigma-70 factor (ECF subfamily)